MAAPSLFSDLVPVFGRLRSAVRTALDTRPRASNGARACAREFGFDKSIGWKIFQIGYGAEMTTALAAVPGARGWEIVLGKLAATRVPEPVLEEIRRALAEFERQLADRRIDRAMLAGMAAASVGTDESRRQIQRLRKQACDANAVILGVQSSTRIGCYMVSPSTKPGMADLAALTIAEGLERRRAGTPWPLFTPISTVDKSGERVPHAVSTIDGSNGSPLVEELSSSGLAKSEVAQVKEGGFVFVGRDPARTDPLTVAFAEVASAVGPLARRDGETVCELSLPITLPTETAVLDVLVHKDVFVQGPIHAELRAGGVPGPSLRTGAQLPELPLDTEPIEPSTLHVPDALPTTNSTYAELCRRASTKLGHSLSDFVCHRVVLAHPPVPCLLTIWWELASTSL